MMRCAGVSSVTVLPRLSVTVSVAWAVALKKKRAANSVSNAVCLTLLSHEPRRKTFNHEKHESHEKITVLREVAESTLHRKCGSGELWIFLRVFASSREMLFWIPAFAGMTAILLRAFACDTRAGLKPAPARPDP
jgi:hypothetical protein